ncbi:MAG: helix-turn-helix domain-containing protein [Actinomycetota bacterium]|nr:helix-turn-helix domain-containing protein [Actinomycetota bacterium]
MRCPDGAVAEALGVNRNTVGRWRRRYLAQGLDGSWMSRVRAAPDDLRRHGRGGDRAHRPRRVASAVSAAERERGPGERTRPRRPLPGLRGPRGCDG